MNPNKQKEPPRSQAHSRLERIRALSRLLDSAFALPGGYRIGLDDIIDLHDLIAERHERGATLVTSNLDCTEWGAAFPNKLLGAATTDRLRHNAYQLILDGKSYRSPKNCPAGTKTERKIE